MGGGQWVSRLVEVIRRVLRIKSKFASPIKTLWIRLWYADETPVFASKMIILRDRRQYLIVVVFSRNESPVFFTVSIFDFQQIKAGRV